MKLRNKLVRLAYQKPELRKELLPLLRTSMERQYLPSTTFKSTHDFVFQLEYEYGQRLPEAYTLLKNLLVKVQDDFGLDLTKEIDHFEQIIGLGKQAGSAYGKVLNVLYTTEGTKVGMPVPLAGLSLAAVSISALFRAAKVFFRVLEQAIRYGRGAVAAKASKKFLEHSREVIAENIQSQENTLLKGLKDYPGLVQEISRAMNYQKQLLKKIRDIQRTLPGKLDGIEYENS